MKFHTTLLLLTIFLTACATQSPQSLPEGMHSAVIEVVNQYNPVSVREDTEYMGMVVKNGDEYTITVTKGVRGAGNVTILLDAPDEGEIVALWHTHGGEGFSRKYYSAVDSAVVTKYQVPFYMADHRGVLQVLLPGHKVMNALQAEREGLGRIFGYAEGKFVSNVKR